jgi:hypothetical protein
MMILYGFGDFRPFWRVQAWAVAHLIPVHCTSGDFCGTIAALALLALAAGEAFAVRQLTALARNVMGRAWQGAHFAADMAAADTTVAAGNG